MLLGYVTGTAPKPSPTVFVKTGDEVSETANPDFVKWVQQDQLVKAWLFGSLSEDALRVVYGLQSSQEVWTCLAKYFNRVSVSRKFDLQSRLQTVSKHGKSMVDYLKEVKTICDQLDSIGHSVTDQEKIYGVLNGLGKEYESIVTMIEGSMDTYPSPCYDDVAFCLTGFDDKLRTYAENSEVSHHLAFNTGRGYSIVVVVKVMAGLIAIVAEDLIPQVVEAFISKSVLDFFMVTTASLNLDLLVRFVGNMVTLHSSVINDLITPINLMNSQMQWLHYVSLIILLLQVKNGIQIQALLRTSLILLPNFTHVSLILAMIL